MRTRKVKVPCKDLVGVLKSIYDENQYNVPQVWFFCVVRKKEGNGGDEKGKERK